MKRYLVPITGCWRVWPTRSSRPSLTRRRRSAGRRTCSRRSRAVSRWAPLLGAGRASPSSWPSTARASWWSSPARASRSWHRPEPGDGGGSRGSGSRAISGDRCDLPTASPLIVKECSMKSTESVLYFTCPSRLRYPDSKKIPTQSNYSI